MVRTVPRGGQSAEDDEHAGGDKDEEPVADRVRDNESERFASRSRTHTKRGSIGCFDPNQARFYPWAFLLRANECCASFANATRSIVFPDQGSGQRMPAQSDRSSRSTNGGLIVELATPQTTLRSINARRGNSSRSR
jgi:hypothetical protein